MTQEDSHQANGLNGSSEEIKTPSPDAKLSNSRFFRSKRKQRSNQNPTGI